MGRVTNMLGITYPIFCGAMGGVSRPQLVSAVAEAGGMGILATAGMKPDTVREAVREIKSKTTKPFGANIAIIAGNVEEILSVLLEEGVKFFTTGAGNPIPLIAPIHEAGGIIFPVVPSARVAKKMEDHGADGVVVEGTEAGGHVGEATTFTLTRQAALAVSIPVISAGGIADGNGIVAAFALGAEGVQLGTRFVASEEAPIHENYKQAILNASDTATFVSGRRSGGPIRIERNNASQKHVALDENPETDMNTLEKFTLPSLIKAARDGDTENEIVTYGQIASIIHEIKSVKQIIEELFHEAEEVLGNLKLDL